MNNNAKKWVKALRSGKYEQANGKLRVGDGFCCLGVACDLYEEIVGKASWEDAYEGGPITEETEVISFLEETEELPLEVRDWLGLLSDIGNFKLNGETIEVDNYNGLAAMNDNGKSFETIADVIEREEELLFKGV